MLSSAYCGSALRAFSTAFLKSVAFAVPEPVYCTDSCTLLFAFCSAELLPNIVVNLFPTICYRVPEGDTEGSLGAASGERPVLWRLAIVAGAWRLLQCCELWNVITKRL